ncbi:MAG: FAD-dependent thymidylate synthase [Chloroflexota bacterium]|nr:FAD-dependent thymidylate synthase [Chloroflexota bacterium]
MMNVVLISHTPDPERTIAAAGRVSSSPASVAELLEKLTPERVERLISHLIGSGHLSVLEHASFTFAIEGVSRVTSHQLVRHRMASYTQQSQRYVSLRDFEYVTPATISSSPEFTERYREAIEAAHCLYIEMLDAGIPAEDARYVLPNAAETRLVMTMNARELVHACSLRLCLRAQWEIVELFERIKAEVEKVAPRIAAELKPKCYRLGYCDEAESCGIYPTRAELVKEGKLDK